MSTENEAAAEVKAPVLNKDGTPRKARTTRNERLEQAFAANPAARVAIKGVSLAEKLDKILSKEGDSAVRTYALNLVSGPPTSPMPECGATATPAPEADDAP